MLSHYPDGVLIVVTNIDAERETSRFKHGDGVGLSPATANTHEFVF